MSTSLTLDTVLVRRNDLMTSELSDTELVMLNIERGSYYGMVETAKTIWGQLDQPHSIANLIDTMMSLYDVDRDTCEREVLAFVNELQQDDLVRIIVP